jgi:hypothetical protein
MFTTPSTCAITVQNHFQINPIWYTDTSRKLVLALWIVLAAAVGCQPRRDDIRLGACIKQQLNIVVNIQIHADTLLGHLQARCQHQH